MLLLALALAGSPPFDMKADFVAMAKDHCATDWPADFQMQRQCLKEQAAGMLIFKDVAVRFGKPLEPALEKCAEDWTKDRVPDWQMIGHCAAEQADAFTRLDGAPAVP